MMSMVNNSQYMDSRVRDSGSTKDDVASPITYFYKGETYMVDTDPFLQKDFNDVNPEKGYHTEVCIYRCVLEGCTPYLLYLMVRDTETDTVVFPNYRAISGGSGDESVEDTESRVLDDFKRGLFDIYPPGIHTGENFIDIYQEDLFRGFHMGADSITFVYDATRIQVPLATDKPYVWVTPYEMFVSKKTGEGVSIDDGVIRRVSSSLNGSLDKRFYHLTKMSDSSLVKDPYVLFLCKSGESFLANIGLSDTAFENDLETLPENTVCLLPPRIQHPLLGNYTFFSSFPLNEGTNTRIQSGINTGLKRYAVFVDIDGLNPLYVENENLKILDELYSPENPEKYSAITFFYKSHQIWCVKSPIYFSRLP
uniref:Uncharacterized protein n=1 Tax=viral metagenome TaxID=1070528 RepID=A0A6C0DY26_9ZZZZ